MEYAADDVEAIRLGIEELERQRAEARSFWCSCDPPHPGRMSYRTEDGYAACSKCCKPVDE